MNCHDFEAALGELASERLMDAEQHERALEHAASCAGCATRLADERALTAGLRIVARAAVEEAPARVGEAVLAAFRGQIPNSRADLRVRTARTRWFYAAASVAAIALIVTLIALVSSRVRDSRPAGPEKAANPGPVAPEDSRPPSPQQQVSPVNSPGEMAVQRRRPANRVRNVDRSSSQLRNGDEQAGGVEIATDFIPLMNRETLAEMDGGQVMRVELPRSALMSFGLPMDMERATERIKADVVVGNDGMARAIRFVR